MSQIEINRIIDQVERTYDGDCWPGSSVVEILDDVSERMANNTAGFPNKSIHQLVRHILATELLVMQRLDGIDYVLTPEEDWPSTEACNALNWERTCSEIRRSKDALVEKIGELTDADLDSPILPGKSSIYVTLHGHIQHNLYHYGQVAIMKSKENKSI